jgi:hypothetical protein
MSEHAAAHIDGGWELQAPRQCEQALEKFRKAIDMDGNAIDAYYGREGGRLPGDHHRGP